jgi:hypothetical protein
VTNGEVELVPSAFSGSNRGVGSEPDARDEAIFPSEIVKVLRSNVNAQSRAAFPANGFQ